MSTDATSRLTLRNFFAFYVILRLIRRLILRSILRLILRLILRFTKTKISTLPEKLFNSARKVINYCYYFAGFVEYYGADKSVRYTRTCATRAGEIRRLIRRLILRV